MSETLLKYLNRQLASEYDSMVNYMHLAAQQESQDIANLLLEFAHEEMDHAAMLLKMIQDQGGKPVQPEVVYAQHGSLLSAVVLSAAEEDSAVAMYEMISQILTDPREQEMIEKTIMQEKEHSEKLNAMVEKLRELQKSS